MSDFLSVFCLLVCMSFLHAADVGIKISGERTIEELALVVANPPTYLDLRKVVLKRSPSGEGGIKGGIRSNIISRVVTGLGKLLTANTSIKIVNLFDMLVDYKMRVGGYRFG